MHKHQRMMFYQIKKFLTDSDPACRIGVLAGLRRIGKTSILTDIDEYFQEHEYRVAKYVDFRKDPLEARQSCLGFIKNYGPLGGSRSKLFRLSSLSFAEYLVFTGKHEAYEFAWQVKINAAMINAKLFLEIQEKYGRFNNFIWAYVDNKR